MSSNALDADRSELAKELMNVLGFNAMLEATRQESIKMAEGQMNSVLSQIRQSNPKIDNEIMKELNASAQEFTRRVINSWDSMEAAKIYSAALIEGLPEKDMRAAIEHYRTPEGQKELEVITAAAQSMNSYISQRIQKETDAAMKDFLTQLRSIAERLKNKKNKARSSTGR